MLKVFRLTGKEYPYSLVDIPAKYIIDDQIEGMGYIQFLLEVKDFWVVTHSNFISEKGYTYSKTLLNYYDMEKNQLNRCHAIYIDSIDEEIATGNATNFTLDEIIASLINHGENFNESICKSCSGEHKNQTHYINVV